MQLPLDCKEIVMSLASSFVQGDSDTFIKLYDSTNDKSIEFIENVRNLIEKTPEPSNTLCHSISEETLYSEEKIELFPCRSDKPIIDIRTHPIFTFNEHSHDDGFKSIDKLKEDSSKIESLEYELQKETELYQGRLNYKNHQVPIKQESHIIDIPMDFVSDTEDAYPRVLHNAWSESWSECCQMESISKIESGGENLPIVNVVEDDILDSILHEVQENMKESYLPDKKKEGLVQDVIQDVIVSEISDVDEDIPSKYNYFTSTTSTIPHSTTQNITSNSTSNNIQNKSSTQRDKLYQTLLDHKLYQSLVFNQITLKEDVKPIVKKTSFVDLNNQTREEFDFIKGLLPTPNIKPLKNSEIKKKKKKKKVKVKFIPFELEEEEFVNQQKYQLENERQSKDNQDYLKETVNSTFSKENQKMLNDIDSIKSIPIPSSNPTIHPTDTIISSLHTNESPIKESKQDNSPPPLQTIKPSRPIKDKKSVKQENIKRVENTLEPVKHKQVSISLNANPLPPKQSSLKEKPCKQPRKESKKRDKSILVQESTPTMNIIITRKKSYSPSSSPTRDLEYNLKQQMQPNIPILPHETQRNLFVSCETSEPCIQKEQEQQEIKNLHNLMYYSSETDSQYLLNSLETDITKLQELQEQKQGIQTVDHQTQVEEEYFYPMNHSTQESFYPIHSSEELDHTYPYPYPLVNYYPVITVPVPVLYMIPPPPDMNLFNYEECQTFLNARWRDIHYLE